MHNLQIRIRRPPPSLRDLELIEAPKPTLTSGAFLARGGCLPGKEGVQALRVRVRDYEHRRGEFLRAAMPWHGAAALPPRNTSSRDSSTLRRTCCSRSRAGTSA